MTFRVRVDIDNAKPPIWRRLDLAGDLTLAQVHRALQSAFMWQDMHLHAFTPQIDGARDRIAPSFGNDGLDDPDAPASEDEVRLDEVVGEQVTLRAGPLTAVRRPWWAGSARSPGRRRAPRPG